MSLFIELIKTIAEAIEESRGSQRPGQLPREVAPPPEETDADADADALPQALPTEDVRKVQRRVQQKQAELARVRAETDARARVLAQRAAAPEKLPAPRLAADGQRLGRLLRQPQSMRDLVVLKEILDRPLALRRDRR